MKVLVTGGGGMIGRALRNVLPEATYLERADGDLRDPAVAEGLLEAHRPTHVIHLAARVGGVKENAERNLEFFEENVRIDTNVLSAAARLGVRRLVGLLSTCAYHFSTTEGRGPAEGRAFEDDLHVGLPYNGNLGYGYAKRALEVHIRLVRSERRLPWAVATPVTTFGPHDDFDPERGHVVAGLIRKTVEAARTKTAGGAVEVWGSGSAVRQFVFAGDVARALAAWIAREETANLIIAADEGIAIADLARAVARAAGFDGEIRFDRSKPEGLRRKVIRPNVERFLPGFRFTPLDEALAETVAWYRASMEAGVESGSR